MATLKDLQDLMLAIPGVSPDTVGMIIGEMQRSLPGEKIYIPEVRYSKKDQIAAAARTLPSGVVAQRYGVSVSYVSRVVRRRKN